MAGRILTDDGGRALDSNGNPISGAKLKAYLAGTSTVVPLYTTRALAVEHASPVVANGAGFFAQMWADDNLLLDVKTYAADDVTFTTPLRTFLNVTPQGAVEADFAELETYTSAGSTVSEALLEAATASREVRFRDTDYEFGALVNLSALSARTLYLNNASITMAADFEDTHWLTMSGDSHVIGPGTINGANIPPPVTSAASLSAISLGTTTTITVTSDSGYRDGEAVTFTGIVGTTQLNSGTYYVANPAENGLTFEIQNAAGNLDTTAYGAYVSGGTVTRTAAYSAGIYKGVGIVIAGSGNGGSIQGVTFTNFPSGPILADSRTSREGFVVRDCTFTNVQTFTGGATNAVVHYHNISKAVQENNRLDTYNWKGYYSSNGSYNQIVRCFARGGVDGHASHYINYGTDNAIINCTHVGISGVGFGFKCSDTTRPIVINFVAVDARAGGMFQGAEDFYLDGMMSWDSTITALLIEGSSTYGAATRGLAEHLRIIRGSPGSAVNHRGIRIAASSRLTRTVTSATKANPVVVTTSVAHIFKENEAVRITGSDMTELNGNVYYVQNPTDTTFELRTATGNLDGTAFVAVGTTGTAAVGGEVDHVTIRDSYFANLLYGIHVEETGFQQTDVDLIDNTFVNIGQYGILAYIGSGRFTGNEIGMDGAATQANIAVYGDGVTTTGILEIANNEFTGATGDNIQIGEAGATDERFSYDQIRIVNNRVRGGAKFLNYNGNVNAADVVNQLVIVGNTGTGLTAGLNITFNAATDIKYTARDNVLLDASFAAAADTITKPGGAGVVAYRSMPLFGSVTWDPGSLADGAGETSAAITVTGLNFGDHVTAAAPYALQGILKSAEVSAADAAEIRIQNETTGVIDLGSGVWRIRGMKV